MMRQVRQMRSPMTSRNSRYIVVAAILLAIVFWARFPHEFNQYTPEPIALSPVLHEYRPNPAPGRRRNTSIGPHIHHPPVTRQSTPLPLGTHPIDGLVRDAQYAFEDWLRAESSTIEEAASAYRKRRGRHPPPGFGEWFGFAAARGCLIVEDFFDQIYHDLEPFWALKPASIRAEAADFDMQIRIRDGVATTASDWFWTQIWLDMIRSVAHLLPDIDIALNAMDEPRLVVPWEKISEYMDQASSTRQAPEPSQMITHWPRLPPRDPRLKSADKNWEYDESYWPIARRGCDPDSASRQVDVMANFDHGPIFEDGPAKVHMYEGFVSNYSLATDICHQPDLQGLHGFFIQPFSTEASEVLFPIFGGSKLAINNDILIPAPMYWEGEVRFTGAQNVDRDWDTKWDTAVWRGVATGGRNGPHNWRGFQRHRFVAMNNGSKILEAEQGTQPPLNFGLPPENSVSAQRDGRLGEWVTSWADVGFVDLMCEEEAECDYVESQFQLVEGMTMDGQFQFKYLPDIDGNSFSGRYLGFLRSTSLPLKSTLFREWHDSRLLAWKHFVPMDSRYSEYYSIMEYFIGYDDSVPGHDSVAKRIAEDGRNWADRVLRREDMQVYTLRLLLEYARISHDEREQLGWVADLLE